MKRNFSFLKKTLTAALFSCAVLGGVAAHAADSQSYTTKLTTTVPSDSFQVIPVDAGWIDQTQDMGYDIATSKLKEVGLGNFSDSGVRQLNDLFIHK